MDILEYSSGQYRQAFTRKSNKPCRCKNFQEYETAWILGFSGKSLLKERNDEIILGKCEFKKENTIFS